MDPFAPAASCPPFDPHRLSPQVIILLLMSRRSSETLDPREMADQTPQGVVSEDAEKAPKPEVQVTMDVDSPYKVELAPEDDPQNMTTFRKWLIVIIISSSALCVTCASSVVSNPSPFLFAVRVDRIYRLPLRRPGCLATFMWVLRYQS